LAASRRRSKLTVGVGGRQEAGLVAAAFLLALHREPTIVGKDRIRLAVDMLDVDFVEK
jgi:hypothetical protein